MRVSANTTEKNLTFIENIKAFKLQLLNKSWANVLISMTKNVFLFFLQSASGTFSQTSSGWGTESITKHNLNYHACTETAARLPALQQLLALLFTKYCILNILFSFAFRDKISALTDRLN